MRRRKVEYAARPGSPISDKQAATVGATLEAMEAEGVALTPKALLERAQDPEEPVHALFDWNDESAARKHRVEWARTLIGSVMVITVRDAQPEKAYYSITDGSRSYVPRRVVLVDDPKLDQVSEQLFQRILSAVEDAESLGLGARPMWASLIAAVRRHKVAG